MSRTSEHEEKNLDFGHELPPEEHEENDPGNQTKDLPMVVHLKGYEDYYADFSWDAKKVMEVLGIRRSRLNQISGEELRVGKARIDRYLRPIYRPIDVEKYLEWTKPTASHKRSTNIIDQARLKLDKTSEDLKTTLSSYQDFLKETLKDLLGEANQSTLQNTEALVEKVLRVFAKKIEKLEEKVLFSFKSLEKQQSLLKTLCENLLQEFGKEKTNEKQSKLLLENLTKGFEDTLDRMMLMEEDQSEIKERLDTILDLLEKQSSKLINPSLSLSERRSLRFHEISKFQNLKKTPKQTPLSLCERKRLS